MGDEQTLAATLGDFVTLLVREISQSLHLARYHAPLVQVERVRIRFGEAKESGSFIEARYPFMADGWDVEMEMGTALAPRLYGEPLEGKFQDRSLLEVFSGLPVSGIKGVNTDWAGFFISQGIQTIGDLESQTMADLKDLAVRRPTVKLWEIHGKSRLLRCQIPFFPATLLDEENLYTILKMDPDTFLTRAGSGKVSVSEIERLADTLEMLAITLDARVLRAMALKNLLRD